MIAVYIYISGNEGKREYVYLSELFCMQFCFVRKYLNLIQVCISGLLCQETRECIPTSSILKGAHHCITYFTCM